jgi:O-antigen ligase
MNKNRKLKNKFLLRLLVMIKDADVSTFLLFMIMCVSFGHNFRYNGAIIMVISLIEYLIESRTYNHKRPKQVIIWYSVFLFYSIVSIFYSVNKGDSFYAIIGELTSFFIVIILIYYIKSRKRLLNSIKIYIIATSYMTIRYFMFESSMFVNNGRSATFGLDINGWYYNTTAQVIAFAICMCIFLFIYEKRIRWLLPIPAICYLLIRTGSRKAVLMIAISIIIFCILKWSKKIISFTTLLILVFITCLGIWFVNLDLEISHALLRIINGWIRADYTNSDHSTIERLYFINESWNMFLRKPITGWGIGSFSEHLRQVGYSFIAIYSHNNYLEMLACLGLVGFLLYYSVYFKILLNTILSWQKDKNNFCVLVFVLILTLLFCEIGVVTYNAYMYIYVIVIAFYSNELIFNKE